MAREPASMVPGATDVELVRRCRGGDEQAWSELVGRYSRYVFAIATQGYRLGPDAAEEVFQAVFVRVFEQLGALRRDDAFRPWIAQLTRRLCVDHLRSSRREQADGSELEPGGTDETMLRLDEALAVREALTLLPEHCREILDRFFARDESYRVIAEALDLPPGTIASRISRCLVKLREQLDDEALTG